MEPPNQRLKLASAEGEPLRLPPRLSCVAKSSVPCARRPGACSLSATPLYGRRPKAFWYSGQLERLKSDARNELVRLC
jgi:hypothetical protein